jgi:hypothetical protein
MKALELLEKHPESAEIVRAWFMGKMIESLKDENVPDEFKDYMREQGIDNDKLGTMIDLNPRMLLDVFDENEIYISVVYENYNSKELNYLSTINNCETKHYCFRRKEAELAIIETAFDILENKLSPKEEEIN